MKTNKATGLDCIPPPLLRDGAGAITGCLTYIINLSFTTGVVPEEWKTAKVVPLFKTGKKEEMENYRPISVLAAASKIAERAMYHQLYQYLDQNSLLSNFKSNFRKSFSTETAVTFFIDNIRRNMEIGLLTGAIYIDLKKAFDTIDHNLLLAKLRRYGIDSQPLKWINSYLKNRHQRVEIDGVLSSPAII